MSPDGIGLEPLTPVVPKTERVLGTLHKPHHLRSRWPSSINRCQRRLTQLPEKAKSLQGRLYFHFGFPALGLKFPPLFQGIFFYPTRLPSPAVGRWASWVMRRRLLLNSEPFYELLYLFQRALFC